MNDRSLNNQSHLSNFQSFSRRATGSLARRVLFISVLLLGLPLLIHTFFLYRREYRDNVDDAFITLRSLAESRAMFVEELVNNQLIILQALMDEIPRDPTALESFLKSEEKEYNLESLFFVRFDENHNPICNRSFCQDSTILSLIKPAIAKKTFIFVNSQGTEKNKWLYVGRIVESQGKVEGALVIATSTERFLSRLTYREYSPYPIGITLIDQKKELFLSSEKNFEGVQFGQTSKKITWTPYFQHQDSWMVEIDKKIYLAVRIPVEGTSYFLLLDVPERNIAHLQIQDYLFRIATLLFVIVIVGGSLLAYFTHRLAKPLRSLSSVMQRTAEGSTHVRFVPDRMGFEINVLGDQMNLMLDSMYAFEKEAEKERLVRERLAEELRIGHQIQSSMLPKDLPDLPSIETFPGYLPAREVSGDFYDLFVLNDGRLLIAIADAADKGISACLFSLSFRSTLRAASLMNPDLETIIRKANELLLRDTVETSFFITAWIGIFDLKTKRLDYCSQGHPPALLVKKNKEIIELSTQGIALGVNEIRPESKQISIEDDDLLFLYTDGLIEAMNSNGQPFGKTRLNEFVRENQKSSTIHFVQSILEEVHKYTQNAPQSDDLTVLALRRTISNVT